MFSKSERGLEKALRGRRFWHEGKVAFGAHNCALKFREKSTSGKGAVLPLGLGD